MNYVFLRTVGTLIGSLLFFYRSPAQTVADPVVKIVLIRHAEKPKKGDNLSCQGINRSMELPALLKSRFGLPDGIYVPAMSHSDNTKHSRMFETIVPFASKYNLPICSKFHEDDTAALTQEIRGMNGTVLVVWEHSRLPAIARCLGVTSVGLDWPDEDYDSIWIITYRKGVAVLQRSNQGLKPATGCEY